MGYSTDFRGTLEFTHELTASQLAYLNIILGEDCREHPEWQADINAVSDHKLDYIDLELATDFSGIRWNGAEKTYSMTECVNLIIRLMQKRWPDFGLEGKLEAQGEDWDDRWFLVVDGGTATREDSLS